MSMKKNAACFAAVAKKYGDGRKGGSGSGGGKKDGDVCDMALRVMKEMMKDVTDVKKISNDKKVAICKSYMDMGKDMMQKMMMCQSQDLRGAMGMAKQLCGGGKMGGSGSGGGKKDGDDFCSNAPANMRKECMMARTKCMKSAQQKKCWDDKKKQLEEKAKKTGDSLTKIVKEKRVAVTQGISKDFTLPKYKKEKEEYEVAFLDTSGADKAKSTVQYTQVAAKSTGRRRLAEGTSVANWVLGFENDDKAIAAQAKVASKQFSDTVAKKSGVQVEVAKASIKTVDVKVVDKPASGSSGGLRIQSPNACIELGDDVKIKRVGDGKLGFDANVNVNGAIDVKNLYIGDVSIEELVRKLVADALKNQ